MSEAAWAQQPPPEPRADPPMLWTAEPATPAELTALRVQLRAELANGSPPVGAGADDLEQLLLVFEELASNGLRHGRPPVRAVITATGSEWLVEVSDAAADRPPATAVGRDPATGGLGLHLVARLSVDHGWAVEGQRKRVWARVELATTRRRSGASGFVPPLRGGGS